MSGKQIAARLSAVVLALAATVGAVVVFRMGVRKVATATVRGEGAYAEPAPDRVPAERKWVLEAMVPAEIRLTVGGLAVQERRERLDMPFEHAVRVSEAEAAAKGWEKMDLPVYYSLTMELHGEYLYRRPDGSALKRTLTPMADATTYCYDIELPVQYFGRREEARTIDELAHERASFVLERLPEMLRPFVFGDPLETHLVRRGGGSAYLVTTLTPVPAAELRRMVVARAVAAGWLRLERADLTYVKDNLTASVALVERPEGAGTMVGYRFSDDEVLISNKEKENDNEG